MKKLIPILMLILVGCKDHYLDDLRAVEAELELAQEELLMSKNDLDDVEKELASLDLQFQGVSRSQQKLIVNSVESDVLSIILDAYSYDLGVIDLSEFRLSFTLTGGGLFAQGEFCTSGIPIDINAESYLSLSPQRRLELIYHEFGHSYLSYLHPQDTDQYDATARLEIMDMDDWLDDLDHFIWARERFWSTQGQFVKTCDGKTNNNFKCKQL